MQTSTSMFSDSTKADLRELVSNISHELSSLAQTPTAEEGPKMTEELMANWTKLVKLLAISPAAGFRQCQNCHHQVMNEATRCGYCWVKLTPPTAENAGSGIAPTA